MIKSETTALMNYKQSHFLNARHALKVGYSMSFVVKLFYKQIITNTNHDDNIRKNKHEKLTTYLI